MKRLRFAFITTVQYSQPVHGHQLALRCVPLNDAGQLLETYTVKIMPGRLPAPQKDGFGNTVFWCSIGSEHNILRYGSRGIARVEEPGQPAPPPNPCLRFPGLRTKPGRILMQVSSAMARGKTLAALDALCHAVHSLLRYQPGATGIYTTAEEAIAGGRGLRAGIHATAWGLPLARGQPMPGQKFITKAHGMASTRRATAVRMQATCVLPQGAMLPTARWSREPFTALRTRRRPFLCV